MISRIQAWLPCCQQFFNAIAIIAYLQKYLDDSQRRARNCRASHKQNQNAILRLMK